MEWIDGVKLTDKAAMAAAGLDIVDFVDVGIECTLRQLLESGLFHADPHPYVHLHSLCLQVTRPSLGCLVCPAWLKGISRDLIWFSLGRMAAAFVTFLDMGSARCSSCWYLDSFMQTLICECHPLLPAV